MRLVLEKLRLDGVCFKNSKPREACAPTGLDQVGVMCHLAALITLVRLCTDGALNPPTRTASL